MHPGDAISLAAFILLAVTGRVRQLPVSQQCQIAKLCMLGVALISFPEILCKAYPKIARAVDDWLPGLLLLIVYWQAGRFFGARNEKLQAWLAEFDQRRFRTVLAKWGHWSETWLGAYFELAYLVCYGLIPLGVAVFYWMNLRTAIDRYWITVLSASYSCYLLTAFAPTLPPRLALSDQNPSRQRIRSANLVLLRHASIHLNTFPSAHVASTVSASLVLIRFVPVVGVLFLLISISIAVAAVLGRYHYTPDVILGALLPVGIFLIVN